MLRFSFDTHEVFFVMNSVCSYAGIQPPIWLLPCALHRDLGNLLCLSVFFFLDRCSDVSFE